MAERFKMPFCNLNYIKMDRKYVAAKELACAQIGLLDLFDPEGADARLARFRELFASANRGGAYSPAMMAYVTELMEKSKPYLKGRKPSGNYHTESTVQSAVRSSSRLLKILQSA